jgi:hypothetical protein
LFELRNLTQTPIAHTHAQTARKIHVAKFRAKRVGVLITTDVAARGIDIPLIDNVVNYDFPPKPELFVHRRARRAFPRRPPLLTTTGGPCSSAPRSTWRVDVTTPHKPSPQSARLPYSAVNRPRPRPTALPSPPNHIRAGRAARMGRPGTALSLVLREELPYLLDLHLYLGRAIEAAPEAPDAAAVEAARADGGADAAEGGALLAEPVVSRPVFFLWLA